MFDQKSIYTNHGAVSKGLIRASRGRLIFCPEEDEKNRKTEKEMQGFLTSCSGAIIHHMLPSQDLAFQDGQDAHILLPNSCRKINQISTIDDSI